MSVKVVRSISRKLAEMDVRMPSLRARAAKCIAKIIMFLIPLCLIYLWLDLLGLAPSPYTCITEIHGKVSSLAGFDFEISETNCDTLANDAAISVFASKPGQPHKTLLFKYDPGGGDPDPVITSIGQHTVQISVPRISSVFFRRDGFKGLSVVYKIDKIDYPDVEAK